MSRSKRAVLDALIAEATVDCYNESECVTGLYTMLEANLAVPFQTAVLGVDVTVRGVDLTVDGLITAVCVREATTQRIPILDLLLPHRHRTVRSGSMPTDCGREQRDHSGSREPRRRA